MEKKLVVTFRTWDIIRSNANPLYINNPSVSCPHGWKWFEFAKKIKIYKYLRKKLDL